jgi:hypothetical protein
MLPDGVAKTLAQLHAALKKRLKKEGDYRVQTTWTYHDGMPDMTALPNEPIGVWLSPVSGFNDEQNAPFNAEYPIAKWRVEIVMQDQGTDPYGYDTGPILKAWSDVMNVLTEEPEDISADSAIDFLGNLNWDFDIGRVAGGDRKIGSLIITFDTNLPLTNCRDPA